MLQVVDSPHIIGSFDSFSPEKVPIFGIDSHAAGVIANLFSGMDVAARTTFPMMKRAAMNCRWGLLSGDGGDSKKVVAEAGSNGDVAEAWLTVKKQLEALQLENGLLRS
ncbi:hypothetical protein RIF29_23000 [Crotalaria pallida]|uniref:Uncharacterized protein n=1 Tax=Crotalaria pallida TaxID=3830 RepID=A0AAN9I9Q0_CROPI